MAIRPRLLKGLNLKKDHSRLSKKVVCLVLLAALPVLLTGQAAASSLPDGAEEELLERYSALDATRVGTGITRFVYLHPSDRPMRADYLEAVQWSAETLRGWYGEQLGRFFPILPTPVVQVVALDNPASYYGTNDPGSSAYLWFWTNVLDEALPKTGASFSDPENVWIFFADAPAGCGQLSGGGTSGIAVMSHNDLRGLVGDPFLDCNGVVDPALTYPPARWIGGQGHELGHAYGLPHPPGCDKGLPTCDYDALMWAGFYGGFPDETYLREEEKTLVIAGPYVADQDFVNIFSDSFE